MFVRCVDLNRTKTCREIASICHSWSTTLHLRQDNVQNVSLGWDNCMNCEGRHYLAKKKLLFKQNNDPVDILIISIEKINDKDFTNLNNNKLLDGKNLSAMKSGSCD